jgi:hypothetical protein
MSGTSPIRRISLAFGTATAALSLVAAVVAGASATPRIAADSAPAAAAATAGPAVWYPGCC